MDDNYPVAQGTPVHVKVSPDWDSDIEYDFNVCGKITVNYVANKHVSNHD